MQIVFLTHNFPRRPGDHAGAFLVPLIHALRARGHEVRVLAPSDRGEIGHGRHEGIPVRRVRYASPARETLAYGGATPGAILTPRGAMAFAALLKALRRAAREEAARGADLFHVHWWVPGGLAVPPEVRYVLTLHGSDVALLARSPVARALARSVIHRARVVTTVSSALARIVQRTTGREILPHKIKPMPAETARFRPGPGPGAGLVCVSRLTLQKRVDLAIRAVAVLRDRGDPVSCTVVGDGPEREALERLTAELTVAPLVTFTGAVAPQAVPELLADKAVMLFPAVGEGFGLVAAEALMAGVSVVACEDGGGVLDVVPRSGPGRVVPPDAAALADAATDLMRHPQRQRLAAAQGEEWRRRLDPGALADVCEEWYAEALRAP